MQQSMLRFPAFFLMAERVMMANPEGRGGAGIKAWRLSTLRVLQSLSASLRNRAGTQTITAGAVLEHVLDEPKVSIPDA